MKIFQKKLLFWLAIAFFICHGSLLPYRRISYLRQTIQWGLETIGLHKHTLILFISIFFKLWKSRQFFFSKLCDFPSLNEKDSLVWIFFFKFLLMKKKIWLYKFSIYTCPRIHKCVLNISGKWYFTGQALSSGFSASCSELLVWEPQIKHMQPQSR